MTNDAETWKFIDAHLNDDVRALALKKTSHPEINYDFALRQIQGRQKALSKLPSLTLFPRLLYPATVSMEQCSSEITAKFKASLVEGKTMADLSGGFGIDTIHFATKFRHCHYVEPQKKLCEIFQHNIKIMNINNIDIHNSDLEYFVNNQKNFDFLYLDPSRRDVNGKRVVNLEECSPNILQYKQQLLQISPKIMLKLSPMLDIRQCLRLLPETSDVYVLSVDNECKELILILQHNIDKKNIKYHAINILKDKTDTFEYDDSEEAGAEIEFATELETYLYEPNTALLKAGAFKMTAQHFELKKLHLHTHLYTSKIYHSDFQGRTFIIDDYFLMKESKEKLKSIAKANIAVRNFPLTADELKKKLKLTDGGDVYLFGVSLVGDKKVIIRAHKAE